ncbi:MAG: VCBS repeat-containing protein [Ferruginibacter sp.]
MKKIIAAIALAMIFLPSCKNKHTLFTKIPSSKSGITFNNKLVENDSINPLDLEFLYNGGGVAAGDFNNDGLPDLYFTASTTSNKLYLNKGGLKFTDITTEAGVTGEGEWSNGAAVVDINNDGLKDIYVCTTIKRDPMQRRNLLYINQGLNADKVPTFKEMAADYGLADTSYSVQASFFDYDNDGDLDMFLVTTRLAKRDAASFNNNTKKDTSGLDIDKLFRNDWNDSLKHPVFTDVSKAAGINDFGFGLGITVADINKDGWKDIYVTNDFYGGDELYINNRNGTFTNKVKTCFKHTSQNAMGNDIADINNDGLPDVFTVDMNPEDNYRKKKNMNASNYYVYQNMEFQKIMLQYVRNTMQLNMGPVLNNNDSVGEPVFGDISFYTNTAETDWSWNPSLADFDNDGNRDLIVTNGYPRDVTDHDFVSFRNQSANIASKKQVIAEIPQIKIPNYAFRNNGNLQFENTSEQWGLNDNSFSNGAVYVDLDNDGDLDYVVNNINDEAFLYENSASSTNKKYLNIQFKGDDKNKDGIGAWAEIYYGGGKMEVFENSPVRGYLSCVDTKAHFGVDSFSVVDSVVIRWPGNKKQVLLNVKTNQLLTADIKNAILPDSWLTPGIPGNALFTDITTAANVQYRHQEIDYIDFDRERLLPHKLSQFGPGLAAGDIDGNGLDDIFVGGTGDFNSEFFLQQPDGKFIPKPMPLLTGKDVKHPENMGLLLFDADNDGDLDLYCASGSNEFSANTKNYQDQFFINDGKGNYTIDSAAFPKNFTSKSCVKAVDYDNDGDLDLFVGGRCLPGSYPDPVSSFIYRNDTKNGVVKFTDVTTDIAKDLQNIGMVCDAIWTDFDNDGLTDLIVVGEWMPVSFFKNSNGKFVNVTAQSGVGNQHGWWNSIAAGDFDNDGDIDYIIGNLGENSFFRASDQYPVNIYSKDFDNNGTKDAIVTVFLKDQQGIKKEYTALNRDDLIAQLPSLRKNFSTYKDFAVAGIHQLFSDEKLKGALELHANNFKSCYLKNNGNGKFEMQPLPVMAQLAPLNGMVTGDFNNDGNLDVAICANDYGNEVGDGRYDAMNGLVLLGNGNGNFAAQTILQSGLFVPGDAKALIKLKGPNNNYLLAASQNRGALKVFGHTNNNQKIITLTPADKAAFVLLGNGKTRKEEMYYGSSFLSQSSSFICADGSGKKIEIINNKGEKRLVQ